MMTDQPLCCGQRNHAFPDPVPVETNPKVILSYPKAFEKIKMTTG
jgi:hypothetical protein